ncbi:MAG: terminase [Armatimonadota bacterium]
MERLNRHNADPNLQALALALCSKDIGHWFDNWVWTYDPRLEVPFIPMILFYRQLEFLKWLEEREELKNDGLGEKSRDMGFTWLCAGYLVYRWLFKPGFKGSIGSRKQALVDTIGDPDSIFEKIRIILRYLPKWMLPAGFDWNEHDNFCKLLNPANGASITGEAGDNIGRGGRSSIYFIDEAAFIERAQKVDAALSANTQCRIYISTPNGMGNLFAQKRFSGKVPVFTMHWKNDPRKNAWEIVHSSDDEVIDYGLGTPTIEIPAGCILRYPWYESEKDRLGDPVIIAQELDIDYTASIEGITIPARWVQAAVNLHKRIKMPQSGNLMAGLDVADEGNAETVLIFRRGPVIGPIHSRTEGGTTDIANWALDLSKAAGAKNLNYDSVGVGAGVAGTYKVKARTGGMGLVAAGINVGKTATDAKWPDGRTSAETFVNLKAELWWIVRRRFEKTYEFVELGIEYPLDELISIPDHPTLIQQLSVPLHFKTEAGKIQIETKKELRKRGVASPDYAESLMLTFAPTPKPVRSAAGGDRGAVNTYKPR